MCTNLLYNQRVRANSFSPAIFNQKYLQKVLLHHFGFRHGDSHSKRKEIDGSSHDNVAENEMQHLKSSRTNWFCFIVAQILFDNKITCLFHLKYLLKKSLVGHFGLWLVHKHENVVLVKRTKLFFYLRFVYIWHQLKICV